MKKLIYIFTLLIALPLAAGAQNSDWKITDPQNSEVKITSWNQLKQLTLTLQIYGLWDNGKMVNNFWPKKEGFSETGALTTDNGKLIWKKEVTGNRTCKINFNATVNDFRLNLSSPKENIRWIDIKKVGMLGTNSNFFMVLTVDNNNTYRWFEVNRNGFDIMNALSPYL